MDINYLIFFALSILIVMFVFFFYIKRKRKLTILNAPITHSEMEIVEKHLPVFLFLNALQKEHFRSVFKEFLYEKKFVGCAGLVITDEIKVVVAAGASLLVANRPQEARRAYDALKWIYIYPSAFVTTREVADEHGVVSKQQIGMLGESWDLGRVVLSWSDVEHGLQDFNDGQNVLLHELAHQLDSESGDTNGSPLLINRHAYTSWAKVLSKEFLKLQGDANRNKKSVIDHYGATNPAEFFAVATETFFEKPQQLCKKHEALYKELVEYYGFDPVNWK